MTEKEIAIAEATQKIMFSTIIIINTILQKCNSFEEFKEFINETAEDYLNGEYDFTKKEQKQ